MEPDRALLAEVVAQRKEIERFVFSRLLPRGLMKGSVRRTRHYREWYRLPMNYVRLIELPLTLRLLDSSPDDRVADFSSPKLLSLYMAVRGWKHLTIADIEEYFVEDFELYSRWFDIQPDIQVIDARHIAFPDAVLDRAFSVSVFEHIPDMGDREAAGEVARVMKPGGIFVLTLPAFTEYVEEWQTSSSYWDAHSVRDEQGAVFFQRRYDPPAIEERFGGCGFEFADVVYVAETPIDEPRIGPNGRMLHNVYYLQQWIDKRWPVKLRRRIPLLEYFHHRRGSQRHHYLTRDARDPNVRQVALKLRRQ